MFLWVQKRPVFSSTISKAPQDHVSGKVDLLKRSLSNQFSSDLTHCANVREHTKVIQEVEACTLCHGNCKLSSGPSCFKAVLVAFCEACGLRIGALSRSALQSCAGPRARHRVVRCSSCPLRAFPPEHSPTSQRLKNPISYPIGTLVGSYKVT